MNAYKFQDLSLGMEESFSVCITQERMDCFLALTGDNNPLHMEDSYAQESGFSSKVVYGMLTASFLSTLAGVYLPGKYCLIHRVEMEFPRPVFIGDELVISGTITEKDDRFRTITVKTVIRKTDGKKVCRGKMKLGVSQ